MRCVHVPGTERMSTWHGKVYIKGITLVVQNVQNLTDFAAVKYSISGAGQVCRNEFTEMVIFHLS